MAGQRQRINSQHIYRWVSRDRIPVNRVGNLIIGSKTALREALGARSAETLRGDADLLLGAERIAEYVNGLFDNSTESPP